MSLHGLLSVTIGVPNTGETGAYYSDFGLTPEADGWYSTADAGRQLRIVPAPDEAAGRDAGRRGRPGRPRARRGQPGASRRAGGAHRDEPGDG